MGLAWYTAIAQTHGSVRSAGQVSVDRWDETWPTSTRGERGTFSTSTRPLPFLLSKAARQNSKQSRVNIPLPGSRNSPDVDSSARLGRRTRSGPAFHHPRRRQRVRPRRAANPPRTASQACPRRNRNRARSVQVRRCALSGPILHFGHLWFLALTTGSGQSRPTRIELQWRQRL